MKFTLSWLKEHLDTDEPLEKLTDKLTMIGLEVEHIEDKAKQLAPFVIAAGCIVFARSRPTEKPFDTIKKQLNADMAMLREVSAS